MRHALVYQQQMHGHVPTPMRGIVWTSFGSKDIHLANPNVPAERALIDTVIAICDKKSIAAVPPIYVANTHILNAASVSGRGLVYTTGIMRTMNHEQLAAITGHELSHHRHASRDMLLMGALGLGGYGLASYGWNALASTALSSKSGVLHHIGNIMTTQIGSILPSYLGMMAAVTPWRHVMELEADHEGAMATKPADMKSALERLSEVAHKPQNTVGQRSWMNRLVRAVLNPFPSHPSTDYRIERMERLQEPSR